MFVAFNLTPTKLILSLLLILVIYLFVRYRQKHKRFHECASKIDGPLAFPVIGSSCILAGGTRQILQNVMYNAEKYKPICKLWLGPKLFCVLSRPEDVQVVLNKSLEKEEGYKYIRPVFGYGLFTTPVKEWKKHRKTVVSTFSQPVLNSFMGIFNEYSKELVEILKERADGRFFDAFPVLTQCTLDIMCSSVMGTKMNAMKEESQFIIWMTKVAELCIIRLFNVYLWPNCLFKLFPISKKTQDLDQKIQNFVKRVIESKRQTQHHDTIKTKKIFLDHLLELTDKEERWNDDELTNETRSVIMAGSDATAVTLSYCCVMLAMHQEIQELVLQEVDSVFGDSDRDCTVEDLSKLQYLERFIKETLRIFPVTSLIGRELSEDVTLSGYTIPKGSSIGIPIFHIHRSEEFWPDPLKFDPDRFLPEEVAKRHPCTYLPFSYGPRNCIGFKYAFMVMKVIFSTLLRTCKVAATSYRSIPDLKVRLDVATKCIEGYPIKLEVRNEF